MASAAAFLDRDGVVNAAVVRHGKPYPPGSPDNVVLLPGVAEACQHLKAQGLLLVIVTNQPDIARGKASTADVGAINQVLVERLPIDAVFVCPHDDADGCHCRKPKPGLLIAASHKWDIDLTRSTMVGDRWRDIEAGQAAEVATVFLDKGYDEPRPRKPDAVAAELIDAVPFILRQAQQGAS